MKRILFAILALWALSAPVGPAHAQTYIGGTGTNTTQQTQMSSESACPPEMMEAGNASVEASVAEQTAIRDGVVNPPTSVLETSCFPQMAMVTANEAGKIFSGDFTSALGPVVLQPVSQFLQSNFLDSIGRDPDFGAVITATLGGILNDLLGGLFGGGMSASSFECQTYQDIADAARTSPISGDIALMTASELISTALNSSVSDENRFLTGSSQSQFEQGPDPQLKRGARIQCSVAKVELS